MVTLALRVVKVNSRPVLVTYTYTVCGHHKNGGDAIAQLPTGTVTFLFTDIEGSTRLWQEHPEGMRVALAGHDERLAKAITANGGHVVKSTGDGAYAVFDRANNAAAGAVAAQLEFQEADFPEVGRLKVRMALHTGEADERQGDYFGPALNRAARLLGTGHGGQILVSAAAREVLSDDYAFVDLGDHRLPDLTRPERVHQLHHPGLPAEFPPLVSVDARPNNLPVQLTTFIGRDDELAQISGLLSEARLVSLTGVGGAGKTRLALQVAAEVLDSFPDGAWMVELAPISDPGLVISHVAEPFGVRDMETDSGRLLVDVLSDYLRDKELVLLLDNCEHLVEPSAELTETLLTRCPQIRILTTSRELLGVPGEAVYPVPPLGIPTEEKFELEETDAVFLFADRAAQVQPGFRLDAENAAAVAEITRRLDGLPLAIELAASRTNVLAPRQILERLDNQLQLITSRRRGEGRHVTLEAAMDWSYELLSEEEQSLFRQLAVFAGGWTLEAAEEVGDVPEEDVLDLLGHLVDQSLVEVSDSEGVNRYRLLEPVRQYALAKLSAADEETPIRRRHAAYFTDLAEDSVSGLRGADQGAWARRLELEHDNVRSAASWCIEAGEDELALRLVGGMGWFWWLRGYWKEAQRWFRRVYEATPDADVVLRGRLVYRVAGLEVQRARPAEVKPLLEDALLSLRTEGADVDVAWVLVYLADATIGAGLEWATEGLDTFVAREDSWAVAYAKFIRGQNQSVHDEESFAEMREAVDSFIALGDRWAAGWCGFVLGHSLALQGQYRQAQEMIELSLELVEGTDDRWIGPHCKSRLGIVATMTGAPEDAKRLFREALPVHKRIGDENCTALINLYLGEVHTEEQDFVAGEEHLSVSLVGYRELKNPYGVANGLRRIGWLAAAQGDFERAARLLGAAETLRNELGGFISTHDADRTGEATEVLKANVPASQLDDWWSGGTDMSREQAIAYALGR